MRLRAAEVGVVHGVARGGRPPSGVPAARRLVARAHGGASARVASPLLGGGWLACTVQRASEWRVPSSFGTPACPRARRIHSRPADTPRVSLQQSTPSSCSVSGAGAWCAFGISGLGFLGATYFLLLTTYYLPLTFYLLLTTYVAALLRGIRRVVFRFGLLVTTVSSTTELQDLIPPAPRSQVKFA